MDMKFLLLLLELCCFLTNAVRSSVNLTFEEDVSKDQTKRSQGCFKVKAELCTAGFKEDADDFAVQVAVDKLVEDSNAEPGCIKYSVQEKDGGWESEEWFVSKEAFDAHNAEGAAFKTFASVRNANCARGGLPASMPNCNEENTHPGNGDCWAEETMESCPCFKVAAQICTNGYKEGADIQAVKDAVAKLVEDSNSEPGCRHYAVTEKDGGWESEEYFADKEAFDAHNAPGAAFKTFAEVRNAHCNRGGGASMPDCKADNQHPGNPDCWVATTMASYPI